MNLFLFVVISYLCLFFLLNFFFDDFFELLKRKGYYFVYTLLEYLAFAYILAYIVGQKKFTRAVLICSALFTLFLTAYFIIVKRIRTVDSIPIGVETILVFAFISYFFYQYFKKIDNDHIYNDPGFWFITGILIYLGSTFFFNILGNIISKQQIKNYWYLTYMGDILKNILFAIAIFLYAKNPLRNANSKKSNVPYLDMI